MRAWRREKAWVRGYSQSAISLRLRFYVVKGEAPDNYRGVASGCALLRGKNVRESALGTRKVSAVRSLEVVASRR